MAVNIVPRPMDNPPAPPPIPAHILALPLPIRLAYWLAYGSALGIPVDSVFQLTNLLLGVARRQLGGRHLRMTATEKLLAAALAKTIPVAARSLVDWPITPDSLVRWLKRYQERMANGGTTPPRTTPKRPWIGQEKVDAILRIYDAGLTGLSRIAGEMRKCGMPVAESTVRKILTANARPPSDHNHRRGSTWAQFWNNHAHDIVGADFLQIPVGLMGKIANAFVFCAIEHDTRRIHLLGITIHPTDDWIAQCLRNATMMDGPLEHRGHVILDNDGKYGARTIAALGERLVWTDIGAPDMNAFIERWNRSVQDECLSHIVFLNEAHLRSVVETYIRHHNTERPHQGIGNVTVGPWAVGTGDIVCDESLGGLFKSFRRAA